MDAYLERDMNTGMDDPLVSRVRSSIQRDIDNISPDAFSRLEHIDELPLDTALKICGEILMFACDAQNEMTIRIGRATFARLPSEWVRKNLIEAVRISLDFNDGWHYMCLLALLSVLSPKYSDLLEYYRNVGLNSGDPELIELAGKY